MKAELKVLSTATSVAGRLANVAPIPGGKLLSKGLGVASNVLNKDSNAMPGNLGQFGKVMDDVQNPPVGTYICL